MKYNDVKYQARVLNRLADRAFRVGGVAGMRAALDKATARIWAAVELHYQEVHHV
jgi:hypothetical protein